MFVVISMVNKIALLCGKAVLRTTGRERAAEVLSRYSSVWEMIPSAYSFAALGLRITRHLPLNTLTVEPTNLCNLACLHCERHTMKRSKGLMEFELFEHIFAKNKGIHRVNLTNWGEPLLHPEICRMVRHLREKGIYVTMFSNGTLLTRTLSENLVKSGLNTICFSLDGVDETYKRIRGWDYDDVAAKISSFLDINNKFGHPLRTEINMVLFEQTTDATGELTRRWEKKVDAISTTQLMKSSKQRGKPCSILWRSMTIHWDGSIVPCCTDLDGAFLLGTAREDDLWAIFNCKKMQNLRNTHLAHRFPPLCRHCSEYHT
jgi:radical SAM protein with 4Fe4S-binding SPASM domain